WIACLHASGDWRSLAIPPRPVVGPHLAGAHPDIGAHFVLSGRRVRLDMTLEGFLRGCVRAPGPAYSAGGASSGRTGASGMSFGRHPRRRTVTVTGRLP